MGDANKISFKHCVCKKCGARFVLLTHDPVRDLDISWTQRQVDFCSRCLSKAKRIIVSYDYYNLAAAQIQKQLATRFSDEIPERLTENIVAAALSEMAEHLFLMGEDQVASSKEQTVTANAAANALLAEIKASVPTNSWDGEQEPFNPVPANPLFTCW